jgi:hypothetical protein
MHDAVAVEMELLMEGREIAVGVARLYYGASSDMQGSEVKTKNAR